MPGSNGPNSLGSRAHAGRCSSRNGPTRSRRLHQDLVIQLREYLTTARAELGQNAD